MDVSHRKREVGTSGMEDWERGGGAVMVRRIEGKKGCQAYRVRDGGRYPILGFSCLLRRNPVVLAMREFFMSNDGNVSFTPIPFPFSSFQKNPLSFTTIVLLFWSFFTACVDGSSSFLQYVFFLFLISYLFLFSYFLMVDCWCFTFSLFCLFFVFFEERARLLVYAFFFVHYRY